jgi:predicted permease
MLKVLEVTLPIFGLVFSGFFGQRLRLVPEASVDALNRFVFHFALPAMLFRAIAVQPAASYANVSFIGGWVLASLCNYFLARTLAQHALRRGPMSATVMAMNVTHPNVGYIGLPLALELGREHVPIMVMAVMGDMFVVVVMSIVFLEFDSRRADRRILGEVREAGLASGSSTDGSIALTVLQGLARSPIVVAALLGLVWSVMALPIPILLDNYSRLLGGAAAPVALFAIGASIGRTNLRLDATSAGMVGWKLLVHPLIAALVLLSVPGIEPEVWAMGVVAACLPSASNTFIIGNRYGVSTGSVAQSIVAGSLLAIVSVSLAIWATGLHQAPGT